MRRAVSLGSSTRDPLPRQQVGDAGFVGITRDQMQMQMIDGSSGGVTHVVADVEAGGVVNRIGDVEEVAGQLVQPPVFFAGVFPKVHDVAQREDQKMAGIVGVEIYGDDKQRIPMHGQIDDRGIPIADQAEDAAVGFGALDIGIFLEVEEVFFHSRIEFRLNSGIAFSCSPESFCTAMALSRTGY